MEVQDYSEKAIVVYGDHEIWKGNLYSLNGRFNRNLRDGPGWVFSKQKETQVREFVAGAMAGMIAPKPYVPATQKAKAPAPVMPMDAVMQTMTPEMALARLSQATVAVPSSATSLSATMGVRAAPVPMKIPETTLPTTPTTLSFPNRFIAGDGVSHQILVYTVPLPFVGQRITLTFSERKEQDRECLVVMVDGSGDRMTVVSGSMQLVASVRRGVWQLDAVVSGPADVDVGSAHTIQFHAASDTSPVAPSVPAPSSPKIEAPQVAASPKIQLVMKSPTVTPPVVPSPKPVTPMPESTAPAPVIPTIMYGSMNIPQIPSASK